MSGSPDKKMFFFYLECFTKAFCHGTGIGAPSVFIVADHVLTDTSFVCQLCLSQPCFEAGAGEKIADTILFQLLTVRCSFYGKNFSYLPKMTR